jgi:hypothetical protein
MIKMGKTKKNKEEFRYQRVDLARHDSSDDSDDELDRVLGPTSSPNSSKNRSTTRGRNCRQFCLIFSILICLGSIGAVVLYSTLTFPGGIKGAFFGGGGRKSQNNSSVDVDDGTTNGTYSQEIINGTFSNDESLENLNTIIEEDGSVTESESSEDDFDSIMSKGHGDESVSFDKDPDPPSQVIDDQGTAIKIDTEQFRHYSRCCITS